MTFAFCPDELKRNGASIGMTKNTTSHIILSFFLGSLRRLIPKYEPMFYTKLLQMLLGQVPKVVLLE